MPHRRSEIATGSPSAGESRAVTPQRAGTAMPLLFTRQRAKLSADATEPDRTVAPARPGVVNVRLHTGFTRCNFSCRYCIAGHGEATTDEFGDPVLDDPTWDEARLRRIVANLCRLPYRLNVRLRVPGEIFLNKRLVRIAEEMTHADNIFSLNLLTNLSLMRHQYERILSGFDAQKLAIVASYHPTEIRNEAAWLESARWANARFDFAVILVADPPLLATLEGNYRKLRAEGFSVFIQPYIGVYQGRVYPNSYSADERALVGGLMYSRHDLEFLLKLVKPGLCHAGANSFYVAEDGRVFPCGSNETDEIANLAVSPLVRLHDGPGPCPFRTCQCDTDNMNTVVFASHYEMTGINQHKYRYRFDERARGDARWSQWNVPYEDDWLAELDTQ